MNASVAALLEALASIESQIAQAGRRTRRTRQTQRGRLALDERAGGRTRSPPLAFIAAIENVERFHRTRDIGAYLGLTERRYQSADTDVGMGISKQGDAMARHYLYEAANVLLTSVKKRFAFATGA